MSNLWRGSVIAALVIGALVVSLIIWCVLRYRRRGPRRHPDASGSTTSRSRSCTRRIPIVIVLVLFGFSWSVQNRRRRAERAPRRDGRRARASSGSGSSTIRRGQRSPGRHRTARPVMVRAAGRDGSAPCSRRATSSTRSTSRTSSSSGTSSRAPTNQFDITVGEAGHLTAGYCAEFCGLDHAAHDVRGARAEPGRLPHLGRPERSAAMTVTAERPSAERRPSRSRAAGHRASCAGSPRPTTSRSASATSSPRSPSSASAGCSRW